VKPTGISTRTFGALLLIVLLAACSLTPRPTAVDGWPIGEEMQCHNDPGCEAIYFSAFKAAQEWLDRTSPEHASILEGHVYPLKDPLRTSGGALYYVLLKLGDGSTEPIQITCNGLRTLDQCQRSSMTPPDLP
jgi:hypothetical protein